MTQANKFDLPNGAGFFRRFGAWFYDALLLIALEMIAIGFIVGLMALAIAFGFSIEGYIDVSDYLTKHPSISVAFSFYVFLVAVSFYGYFWTTAGQTLGMRAWKLEIISEYADQVTWTQAMIRLATSAFGLGNLLVFFSPKNRAFQDLFSHTQIIIKK